MDGEGLRTLIVSGHADDVVDCSLFLVDLERLKLMSTKMGKRSMPRISGF